MRPAAELHAGVWRRFQAAARDNERFRRAVRSEADLPAGMNSPRRPREARLVAASPRFVAVAPVSAAELTRGHGADGQLSRAWSGDGPENTTMAGAEARSRAKRAAPCGWRPRRVGDARASRAQPGPERSGGALP